VPPARIGFELLTLEPRAWSPTRPTGAGLARSLAFRIAANPCAPVLETSERNVLDQLLADLRGGQSALVVIPGEADIGKAALLTQYRASCR
jgi:hypothetical protein